MRILQFQLPHNAEQAFIFGLTEFPSTLFSVICRKTPLNREKKNKFHYYTIFLDYAAGIRLHVRPFSSFFRLTFVDSCKYRMDTVVGGSSI